jgi:hypothetical protein
MKKTISAALLLVFSAIGYAQMNSNQQYQMQQQRNQAGYDANKQQRNVMERQQQQLSERRMENLRGNNPSGNQVQPANYVEQKPEVKTKEAQEKKRLAKQEKKEKRKAEKASKKQKPSPSN